METPDANPLDQLLREARQEGPAGRDRLFAACRDDLVLAARGQLESRLHAKLDPSDLVQQTLLEAHRDFDRFQGQTAGQWWGWLRSILERNAADVVRSYLGTAKRQARREVGFQSPADSAVPGAVAEPAAEMATPSQDYLARDRDQRLAQALQQLPPDYRQVIELRNLERLPFDEVARRMERSRPAVQMLWARALKKLQDCLGDTSLG